jgi:ubiquinone/menaquinone biosynthesis C-methylase UbiE
MLKPYLDYYTSRGIIPVHQDLSDLKAHFNRRSGLYRSLGIVPGLLAGKAIIEIGPGTGDNALHTASLAPAEYVLIDGNPESIRALRAKQASGALTGSVSINERDILGFRQDAHYDVVLCEGVIPIQVDPAGFLRHIARLAKPGGVVVLTTVSATSVLAEVCRRMFKPLVAAQISSFDAQVEFLTDFFKPDLESLKGMSRGHRDWVLDCIMHPWGQGRLFSIPDAIDAIGEQFDFHGASPNFVTDWRWYKTMVEDDFGFNRVASAAWRKGSAATIDHRCDPGAAQGCDGAALEVLCQQAVALHRHAWEGDDREALDRFLAVVSAIADLLRPALPETAHALAGFVEGIGQFRQGIAPHGLAPFRPLFGRGQQYVSFIRRH